MDKYPISISIVIPCFNEEKNIESNVLAPVATYLSKQPFSYEVIIVDDGSSDKTVDLLDKFISGKKEWKIIKNSHRGKGNTVVTGILSARGQIILFTDFDQATPIYEIEKILPYFKSGYDVVIGSRNAKRQGAPFFRLLMARSFMVLRTLILGLSGIEDTQCGFKAFKYAVAHDIFQRLKVYGNKKKEVSGSQVTAGFDVESLFLARKLGYKIKEVPVIWHYVETRRVNPIKDSYQGFIDIVKIRLNDIKHEYNNHKQ